MRTILLKIAYDGTDFAGYQVQPKERTVQGVLEEALASLHDHPVRVTGAGRTDSGVHARGQYVSFESDRDSIGDEAWIPAANSRLPRDIRTIESRIVRPGLSARYDARRRHYRYYIDESSIQDPTRRRYSFHVGRRLDLERMNDEAACLVGEHDFTTFSVRRSEEENPVRNVYYADFSREGDMVSFAVGANGFLWRMVRSIVGSLVERELKREVFSGQPFERLLSNPNRSEAGTTAPPQGLFFHDVDFSW